jgi:aminoglycoside 3-N-acetyltransferase
MARVSTDVQTRFAGLLERLEIPRDRPIYVQSSVDWIQRAGFEASDVLKALTGWIGPAGTIVMPSYPFVGSHREYLGRAPVYDVRRTPALSGLLSEIFRRTPAVLRSLDPDFCVSASGAEAGDIVGLLPADTDPFGPDSPYQRMLDRRAALVGLGVSLNTSSFIHVIDSRAGASYLQPPYEDRLFDTSVIDTAGLCQRVPRRALRPPFQQLTRPSAVLDLMRPSPHAFAAIDVNGARFFRWDLGAWSSWCLAHARTRAAERRWPCWLEQLSGT